MSTGREDIAMSTFRKNGISYYNPQMPEWSTRYIPLEAAVKDSCRLLLYVITGDTRGVTSMLEVRQVRLARVRSCIVVYYERVRNDTIFRVCFRLVTTLDSVVTSSCVCSKFRREQLSKAKR